MQERIAKLRTLLSQHEIDSIVVTNPLNFRHLTGFSGDVGLLFVQENTSVLAVDSRYTEQAKQETQGITILQADSTWGEALCDLVRAYDGQRVGIESEYVTVSQWQEWQKLLGESATMQPLKGQVSALRMVKNDAEISRIERAAQITDEAFAAFCAWLKPGVTEKEGAWFIESYMRTHGADDVGFDPIVASGPNGALPHAQPGQRQIAIGEPVVVDIGARVQGYNSDMTRTVCLGRANDDFAALYDLVLRSQLAAEQAIKAGISGREADAIARDVITKERPDAVYLHGLGHGVGLAIHEEPRLSMRAEGILQPGHIITIEPAIYIPDWGGIRIEDIAVVTDSGIRILSKSTKEPWIAA